MKDKILRNFFLFLFALLPLFAGAQDSGNKKAAAIFNGAPPSETAAAQPVVPKGIEIKANNIASATNPFSSFEFLLSIAVLSFGLIVVFFEVYLSIKRRLDRSM